MSKLIIPHSNESTFEDCEQKYVNNPIFRQTVIVLRGMITDGHMTWEDVADAANLACVTHFMDLSKREADE